MKKSFLIFTVMLALCVAVPAMALPTAQGNPQISGNWAQEFNESGIGNFNGMEAFMLTGGITFEAPGFSGFSPGGWSGQLVNPSYIEAAGQGTANMNFNIAFTTNVSVPFSAYFLAWNGATLLELDTINWSGSSWNIVPLPLYYYDYLGDSLNRIPSVSTVPEPATMLLLGIGLIGLTGARRKTKT